MADGTTRRYVPRELHFPSVASRLEWMNLPIIDWPDIDPRSREYLFLKEIGVKEVPDLRKLFERLVEEHNKQSKKANEYRIPLTLKFFAEHFQQYYSKSWKDASISIPFLPSISLASKTSDEVFLSKPTEVFKGFDHFFSLFSSFVHFRIESIVSICFT